MKFNRLPLSLASALVFVVGVVAHAQDHQTNATKPTSSLSSSVRLGEKVVVIPTPEGYEEATSQFKKIKDRFSATEAPENDMLLVHMLAADCELMRQGSNATFSQYTKVSVLRQARALTVTSAMMAAAVEELRAQAVKFPDPNNPTTVAMEKHLERALSNLNSKQTTIDFGKPEVLGEFNVAPNVFSLLMLLNVKLNQAGVEGKPTPMLMSVSYVRVKERIIFVYVYKHLESKADLEPLKAFTTNWTNAIVAAN
jgi:hypothetical protein